MILIYPSGANFDSIPRHNVLQNEKEVLIVTWSKRREKRPRYSMMGPERGKVEQPRQDLGAMLGRE